MKSSETCPGERVCTTSLELGECAKRRVSLEEHCRRDRCHLFFTKVPDSVPRQYEALLDAAIRLKEAQLGKIARDADDVPLSIWELEAFLTFERADRIVQNEKYEKDDDDSAKNNKRSQGFRGKGSSSAFDFTDEQLRKMYEERNRREEARKRSAGITK